MPQVNSGLVPDGIYFGIDNGSSGLRAAYVAVENGLSSTEPIPIENNHHGTQSRLDPGDFDVVVPIDGDESQPYYYGDQDRDPNRQYTRLKYIIPVLALNDADLALVDSLIATSSNEVADQTIAARLDVPPQCVSILRQRGTMRSRWTRYLETVAIVAFRYLKRCLDNALSCSKIEQHRHLPVRRYNLTIPDQWSASQADAYKRIIRKAFGADLDRVRVCLESEAQHMYYHTDTSLQAKLSAVSLGRTECCFVLSNDFGGHSANSALYFVYRNPSGGLHYCRVTDPVGTCGGSELWEHFLSEVAIKATMRRLRRGNHVGRVDPESVQEMLDHFNMKKKTLKPDTGGDKQWSYDISYTLLNDRGRTKRESYTFQVSTALAIGEFEKSMKGPFETFRGQLADAILRSKRAKYPLFVLVHGGMTSNKLFEDRLQRIASGLQLEDPKNRLIFTYTFPGNRHRSCHLAMGAAQLAADSQSFEEFMEGAAIGLQVLQAPENGETPTWDDLATYIPIKSGNPFGRASRGRNARPHVVIKAGDRLRLVVDPLYNVKHPVDQTRKTFVNLPAEWNNKHHVRGDMLDARTCCYDLYTFQGEQSGEWIRLRWFAEEGPSADTAHIVLEKSHWAVSLDPTKADCWSPYRRWLSMTARYDPGSRLWLTDEESTRVHKPRSTTKTKPREQLQIPSGKRKAPAVDDTSKPSSGPLVKRPRGRLALPESTSSYELEISDSSLEHASQYQDSNSVASDEMQLITRPTFGPATRPSKSSSKAKSSITVGRLLPATQQPLSRKGPRQWQTDDEYVSAFFDRMIDNAFESE